MVSVVKRHWHNLEERRGEILFCGSHGRRLMKLPFEQSWESGKETCEEGTSAVRAFDMTKGTPSVCLHILGLVF